jgi:tetratricopeptide (TPR) repeat protein
MLDADERFKPEIMHDIFKLTERDLEVIKFNVHNLMQAEEDAEPRIALTQSARLYRNIPEFYYTGLIHETIDDSVVTQTKKRKLNAALCQHPLIHFGYVNKRGDRTKKKMNYYEQLNLEQLEVTENLDPRPYFNLAMHYINDSKEHEALTCFQKALEINPRFYHAAQQMAALNAQNTKHFLLETLKYMPDQHPLREKTAMLYRFLDEHCKGFVKVD